MNVEKYLEDKISGYVEAVADKSIVNKEFFSPVEIEYVKKEILKDLLIKIKAKATRNKKYLNEIKKEGEIRINSHKFISKRLDNTSIFISNLDMKRSCSLVNKETVSYILKLIDHYAENTMKSYKYFGNKDKQTLMNGSRAAILEDINKMIIEVEYFTKYYNDNSDSEIPNKSKKPSSYNNQYSYQNNSNIEVRKASTEKKNKKKGKLDIKKLMGKSKDFFQAFF